MAAELLAPIVQPFAAAAHRGAPRRPGARSCSPRRRRIDVVRPLAERLGLDDVIATRYGERDDGTYDGTIDGRVRVGQGQARAVARWAADNGVDLAESFAYSDSYYDLPLLSAVGHPVAVNPDPRLLAAAVLRRWPVLHLDVPAGHPQAPHPRRRAPADRHGLRPSRAGPLRPVRHRGLGAHPAEGPGIIVGNHRSYFDPLAMGLALAKRGRPVRFLGKKEVFDVPLVGPALRAMGGIRVDRGTGSDEPLKEAAAALVGGQLVAIMPQGTIPRGPAFFDPVLKGRWGAARLAAMSGAPVIPVGLWGTEKVWPRSSKVPFVWNVLRPPTIRIRVGPPVEELKGRSPDADTKRIMAAIVDLLPPEAKEHRVPTEEELARTYPSGKVPTSGDHEAARRPGTD